MPSRTGLALRAGTDQMKQRDTVLTVVQEGIASMAWYMIQVSYTPDAWAAQIKNPTERIAAVGQMMAPIGVTFEHYWYSFGDHDVVIIAQGPGNVEAAAGVLAAYGGGALTSIKTTPLMTTDEAMAALRMASDVQYRPPAAAA